MTRLIASEALESPMEGAQRGGGREVRWEEVSAVNYFSIAPGKVDSILY